MSRILVVDDEAESRALVVATLRSLGHDVTEAPSGRDGCLLAERDSFDCVLVDAFMPDMDGLETIQTLKEFGPHLRVVALVDERGIGPDIISRLALRLGADHAVRKPATSEGLQAALRETAPPATRAAETVPAPSDQSDSV